MDSIHCEYCGCPKDIWKKTLTTYDGDECKLYDSFMDLIYFDMTPEELIAVAKRELPKEFPDITNIDATVKELVDIAVDCGVIVEHPIERR